MGFKHSNIYRSVWTAKGMTLKKYTSGHVLCEYFVQPMNFSADPQNVRFYFLIFFGNYEFLRNSSCFIKFFLYFSSPVLFQECIFLASTSFFFLNWDISHLFVLRFILPTSFFTFPTPIPWKTTPVTFFSFWSLQKEKKREKHTHTHTHTHTYKYIFILSLFALQVQNILSISEIQLGTYFMTTRERERKENRVGIDKALA